MLTTPLATAPAANEQACQQLLLSSTAPGGEDLSGKRNAADRGRGRKIRKLQKRRPGPRVPTQHWRKMSTPRRSWAGVSRCHQPLPTTSQLQNALVQRKSGQALWKCLNGPSGGSGSPLGPILSLGARSQRSRAVGCPMPPLHATACSHLHRMQSPAPALPRSCSPAPSQCQPAFEAMADPAWCVGTSTHTARPGPNRLDMLARRPPGRTDMLQLENYIPDASACPPTRHRRLVQTSLPIMCRPLLSGDAAPAARARSKHLVSARRWGRGTDTVAHVQRDHACRVRSDRFENRHGLRCCMQLLADS